MHDLPDIKQKGDEDKLKKKTVQKIKFFAMLAAIN